jgi:PAS domain S-box-containing protein
MTRDKSPPRIVRQAWQALSLKGRLIAATVGLLASFMWLLAFLSATVLQNRLEALLAAQQFAFTRQAAADLEAELQDRIDGLARAAAALPADLSYNALQPFLDQRLMMQGMFGGGIAVIGLDGRAIADSPTAAGRRGSHFGDRAYFHRVVATGKPYIDKPIIGRALQRPVLVIAVPAFDAEGKVRAVMTGVTDLTAPNFLNIVADPNRVGASEYFVLSVRDRIIVAATDSARALTPLPAPGRNLQLDRMLDGYEGSGIALSSEGIEKLYSGKRIPAADWLLLAALPTDVAFAPVRTMRNLLFAGAALLTLLAVLAIGRIVRGMLVPLDEAGAAMRRMTDGQEPLAPLPVARDDEVGQLIGNFNRLADDRRRYETALAESEQRFRMLVERAPEAIFVQVRSRFAYANEAALALFGAKTAEQLVGSHVMERVHPDYRDVVAERIRRVNEERLVNPIMEQIHLRLDGTVLEVEALAVPVRYGKDDGALVFARDIGQRKALERERTVQAQRLVRLSHRLVATQEEERRRLSAALHDRTSPNLAALGIMLRTLAREPRADAQDGAALIEDARALLDDTTASIREICGELRPPLLDYAGLLPALQGYAENFTRRTGIRVQVNSLCGARRLPSEIESNLFRIAQEAMTNCAKHAQANKIDIMLSDDGETIGLAVADDGIGFDRDSLGSEGQRPGLGLLTLQERVEFVGGTYEISSRPGSGTRIAVSMPIARYSGKSN